MIKLRLLPVLVFGLVSLLTIKFLSFAFEATTSRPQQARSETSTGERIARAVERAREGVHDDQILTGSVGAKDKDAKDKDGKDKDTKAPKPGDPVKAGELPDLARPKIKSEPEGVRLPPPPGTMPERGTAASPSERELLEKLKDRRDALAAKDRDLEMRDSLLRATERKLDEKIGQLRTMETAGDGAAGKNDPKSRYRTLVVMYENMKPKEAARVFDRLDVKVLLDLVGHMNPRKMSEILAVMEPAAAEKLTVALARQAAAVPVQDASASSQDMELQRLPVSPPRR